MSEMQECERKEADMQVSVVYVSDVSFCIPYMLRG